MEFDGWRLGLNQCTPLAVQSTLGLFAGDFGRITDSARSLPRPAVVRGLADELIDAAEQEEAALRLLRDTWQLGPAIDSNIALATTEIEGNNPDTSNIPADNAEAGNPSNPGSPFEIAAAARSQAELLRRSVADSILDRSSMTDVSSQADIDTFSVLFQELENSWNRFHNDYDEIRTQVTNLSADEAATRLGGLVSQFSDIVSAVQGLPDGEATLAITRILFQASQGEDRSLRELRGTAQDSGSSEAEANGNGANGDAAYGVDTSIYADFDSQVAASNDSREEARRALALTKQELTPESKSVVATSTEDYNALTLDWDSFHKDYDEWRNTDGGCNRSQMMQELGRFGVSFSEIARDARNLPAATVLRPMGELLVEAAEREERALRDLGDSWQPYDPSVYAAVDQERTTANKFRRQVTAGLQELLERFGISP